MLKNKVIDIIALLVDAIHIDLEKYITLKPKRQLELKLLRHLLTNYSHLSFRLSTSPVLSPLSGTLWLEGEF